jgi:hypothetical protein
MAYKYYANGSPGWLQTGGLSVDYCEPRDGGLTTFRGFKLFGKEKRPVDGCRDFFVGTDCRFVQEFVVLAIGYPESNTICEPAPGTLPIPLVFVAVDLPLERPIQGFVFVSEFLSVKMLDWLFEPIGGLYHNQCGNEQAKQEFDRRVAELRARVQAGEMDEETAYKMQQLEALAHSIHDWQP